MVLDSLNSPYPHHKLSFVAAGLNRFLVLQPNLILLNDGGIMKSGLD